MKMKSVQSIHPCESVIQTIYDIVKAHGGELKVETKEGEGSEFSMLLPLLYISDIKIK
jgi:light-regulated signal transduction histidine kinase (bacteriophytochrome)